jgi:hypothetical protein
MYMWEAVNQRDNADFENDIIASTNEVTYTRALLKESAHPLFDRTYLNERVLEGDESMLIYGDCNMDDEDDRELSLDMADFLNDGNPAPQMPILEGAEAEVYAGERQDCSNCGEEAEDDNALDSTFVENISYLPEPESTFELRPFDSFDNMSFSHTFDRGHTSILRPIGRNRFGSEAASPVQAGKTQSRLSLEVPIQNEVTMQINTCIKPVCRTPSAQISSFYESRFESADADRLTPPHLLEQTQFAN